MKSNRERLNDLILNKPKFQTVWVLEGWYIDEAKSSILGVLSTKEIAEETKKLFDCAYYEIYPFEIDVI
jgi:hypothetical protein